MPTFGIRGRYTPQSFPKARTRGLRFRAGGSLLKAIRFVAAGQFQAWTSKNFVFIAFFLEKSLNF